MSQTRILLSQDEAGLLADVLAAVRASEMPDQMHFDRDLLKRVQHQCWAAVARGMLNTVKADLPVKPAPKRRQSDA